MARAGGAVDWDVSINSHAPIVVMTTEVLRNMLYAESTTLENLGFVVMDEVHYLADKFRGAVWEEVIIHLSPAVQLIALSATVSNAEEFGDWLSTVRGDTAVVVTEHRPVPLWQHVLAGDRILELFNEDIAFDQIDATEKHTTDELRSMVNGELLHLAKQQERADSRASFGHKRGRSRSFRGKEYPLKVSRQSLSSTVKVPRRPEVIKILDENALLPAIIFIFSRKGCDQGVEQCVRADLWLTTESERRIIAAEVEKVLAHQHAQDLSVLGYWTWREGLLRGVAAHHAGMLPQFKEIVEQLFARGLIKAVFATETLALGVNMPARCVLLEKLDKFNGEAHVDITPGEYTQLTGRAGRRGIDVEGHAVLLWTPHLDPISLAGLASHRSYPIRSSFRPTYNMSINLIAQFGVERTRNILESSFAQFQVDRSVVSLARDLRNREQSLAGYEKSMHCELGDFSEYAELRNKLSELEKKNAKRGKKREHEANKRTLLALKPGDIVRMSTKHYHGLAMVVQSKNKAGTIQVHLINERAKVRALTLGEQQEALELVSYAKLGKHASANSPEQRRALVDKMLGSVAGLKPPRQDAPQALGDISANVDSQIAAAQRAIREHPVHSCPERESHLRWYQRWITLRKDTDRISQDIRSRTNSIVKTFDRVTQVLHDQGYLVPDPENTWALTERGVQLRKIYGERDLLSAMVLGQGDFDELDAAQLASLVSTLVYQPRRETQGEPRQLPKGLEQPFELIVRAWSELEDTEAHARLPLTQEPSTALMWPMYLWARGRTLAKALEETDLAAGDFVRWSKQVIDLLDQLANVPGVPSSTSNRMREAIQSIRRGVVDDAQFRD